MAFDFLLSESFMCVMAGKQWAQAKGRENQGGEAGGARSEEKIK